MGYYMVMAPCVNCQRLISFNPHYVPSIRLTPEGEKFPLCESCFNRWNVKHRTSHGLEPVPLDPRAYKEIEEGQL